MANRIVIDIETFNSGTCLSTKQGPGPIISATNWQQTTHCRRRADRSALT